MEPGLRVFKKRLCTLKLPSTGEDREESDIFIPSASQVGKKKIYLKITPTSIALPDIRFYFNFCCCCLFFQKHVLWVPFSGGGHKTHFLQQYSWYLLFPVCLCIIWSS